MTLRENLRIFAILAGIVTSAVAAAAQAQSYDAIYVFGDSYCDVGNLYKADHGIKPPSPPYYNGRFSNGHLWIEHLGGTFNLHVLPSLDYGTDYAFGGAELLQDVVTPIGTIPSVQSQVELYLAQHGGKADSNALYVLEGGGNDILDSTSTSLETASELGFEIGATLASLEVELRQLGATHFLIPNLFSVGLLPAGRANASFDETAVVAANTELGGLLEVESHQEGVHIYSPDIFHLWHAIYTDPTHYGFQNITRPCLNATTGAVCADPAHTLYWDEEHPTTFGHSFLAVATEALVHP